MDKYMTREQTADYLGISLGHLAQLLKEPHPLPVFRLGRRLLFRVSEVDRWLEEYRAAMKEVTQQ